MSRTDRSSVLFTTISRRKGRGNNVPLPLELSLAATGKGAYDVPPLLKQTAKTSSLSLMSPVLLRNWGEPISCVKIVPAGQPPVVHRLWLLTPLMKGPPPATGSVIAEPSVSATSTPEC